jgi:hypothetical protein
MIDDEVHEFELIGSQCLSIRKRRESVFRGHSVHPDQ